MIKLVALFITLASVIAWATVVRIVEGSAGTFLTLAATFSFFVIVIVTNDIHARIKLRKI